MPVFDAATDQPEFVLPDPGPGVFTLTSIEDAPDRGLGPTAVWKFLYRHPTTLDPIVDREGNQVEIWQYSSLKMSPRAKARMFCEALLGRELDVERREVPDIRTLIGRSMKAMLIHEKRSDGRGDRAALTMIEPYDAPAATAVTSSPSQPATPPPTPDSGTGLREQVNDAIRKAHVLATPQHLDWLAVDLNRLNDDDLAQLLGEIQKDILAG